MKKEKPTNVFTYIDKRQVTVTVPELCFEQFCPDVSTYP